MDSMVFTLKIIEATAWPIAVTTSVLVLRRPLIALFPRLKKVSYKGARLEFNDEIKEVSETAKRLEPPIIRVPQIPETNQRSTPAPLKPINGTDDSLADFRIQVNTSVVDSPSETLLSGEELVDIGWRRLFRRLREASLRIEGPCRSVHGMIEHLLKQGHLKNDEAKLIIELYRLERKALKGEGREIARKAGAAYYVAADRIGLILQDRL